MICQNFIISHPCSTLHMLPVDGNPVHATTNSMYAPDPASGAWSTGIFDITAEPGGFGTFLTGWYFSAMQKLLPSRAQDL